MRLRLATRGSALARTQSGWVADQLRAQGHDVELVRITTHGDVTSAPLASLGGAGVFVGAVRAAVLAGEADLAVHSFKDLPTAPAAGLLLAAVPQREDPADALCSRDGLGLAELPPGARVGTGSPRRAAQLLALRPDLEIVELRGNVETRLRRTADDLDAVVLAAAGLRRLGLADRITELLAPPRFLPAPAQGALAVECRSTAPEELLEALAGLDDVASRCAALAERAVLAGLQAGCAAPVAAQAEVTGGRLTLRAVVVTTDGRRSVAVAATSNTVDPGAAADLGTGIAARLLADGAGALVDLTAAKPRPLAGRSLLLPDRLPAGLAEALAGTGAELARARFTSQEPLPLDAFRSALARHWDWLVVSSPATLRTLAAGGLDLATLVQRDTRVAAVGPATAAALAAAGVEAALVADPGSGAALAAAFPSGTGRVLLPGAEQASAEPAAGLAAKGWHVQPVAVYRTVPEPLPPEVVARWRSGGFDAVVVTAGSTARAAVAGCGLPGPGAVCIGAPSAAVCRDLGLDVLAVAATPDAGGLVDALLAALA